jgi:hypothetical protein
VGRDHNTTARCAVGHAVGDHGYAGVSARRITDADEILAARRLHAATYLAKRYVEPHDIVDGLIGSHIDPWATYSTYFLARDAEGAPVGVGRHIQAPRVGDLPALALDRLDASMTADIRRQGSHLVVEISALAVAAGAPAGTSISLYSAMWEHGIACGHTAWVMSVHPAVARLLTGTFGPVLTPFGPRQWFMGSDVVPAVLWTDTFADTVASHAPTLADPLLRRSLPLLFPHNAARRAA